MKTNLLQMRKTFFLFCVLILFVSKSSFAVTFTLSNPSDTVKANSAYQNDTKVKIYSFIITGSSGSANLNNFSFTTTGTYAVADISNFKIWSSITNSIATASLVATNSSPSAAGSQTFSAFSFAINPGVATYFWITADIASGATCNRTIAVNASASSDMTPQGGVSVAGSTGFGGGTITLKPIVSSAAYGTATSGTAQSYSITSNTGSTTYSWSRAAVTGISNAAASGQTSNPIIETLTNTTTSAILVTYVITPTSGGCAGKAFNYEVSVNPTTTGCAIVPAAPTPPTCGTFMNPTSGAATTLVNNADYGFCGTTFTTGNIDNGNNTTRMYVLNGQTLTTGTLNSADIIYVMKGGTLNITSNISQGTIYVYGTINLSTGQNIQGTSTVYIAPGANFVGGSTTFQGSSNIINEGTVTFTNFAMSTSGTMCVNNSGCVQVNTFGSVDSDPNFVTNSGNVGYIYSPQTTCPAPNKNLGNSTNMKICSAVPVASSPCTRFASATVKYGCTPGSSNCTGAIALPIILKFFKTSMTSEGVLAKWGTNSQWNSDYFIIERSNNGIDWEQVATVPAKNGIYSYNEFSITDPKPFEGDNYYRLNEADKDGAINTYAVDYVYNENSFNGFSIFPNPSKGDLNVNIFGLSYNYKFEMMDVSGKTIYENVLLPGSSQLSNLNLSSGIYFAKLKVGSDYFVQKLIITK